MKKQTPPWKRNILSSRDWPKGLEVPCPHKLPANAELLRELPDWTNRFMFSLHRDKAGMKYYLRVWPNTETGLSPASPAPRCVTLNPLEALRLLVLQEVGQDMADDVRRYRRLKRSGLK